jgi:hypothetical protein
MLSNRAGTFYRQIENEAFSSVRFVPSRFSAASMAADKHGQKTDEPISTSPNNP